MPLAEFDITNAVAKLTVAVNSCTCLSLVRSGPNRVSCATFTWVVVQSVYNGFKTRVTDVSLNALISV